MAKKQKKEKKTGSNTGAPRCKLCGANHWLREPHHFAPAKKKGRTDNRP